MKNFERKKVKVKLSSKEKTISYKVKLVVKNLAEKKENTKPINRIVTRYVLDNSIIGKMTILEFVSELIEKDEKIVITSLFIKGLEETLKENSSFSKIATELLSIIAEDEEHFEVVKVDEEEKYVDDCIMAYCCESLEKVVLVVGNGLRATKSRLYEVKYVFLSEKNIESSKSYENSETDKEKSKKTNNKKEEKLYTLSFIKKLSGELVISEFKKVDQYICLYSKDKIYNEGIRVLHVGDEILVATKKPKYINFYHYKVCRLTEKENCIQLYHKKIYNINHIKISSTWYKDFLNDFKKIFDL